MQFIIQKNNFQSVSYEILALCFENRLFEPTVYISTKNHNDFLTPLDRFFQIYREMR